MCGGVRHIHPSPVGDVPRVGGSPPRHGQLLHQLPHLLLRLLALQEGALQGVLAVLEEESPALQLRPRAPAAGGHHSAGRAQGATGAYLYGLPTQQL